MATYHKQLWFDMALLLGTSHHETLQKPHSPLILLIIWYVCDGLFHYMKGDPKKVMCHESV